MNTNLINEYYNKLYLYSSHYKATRNIKKNKDSIIISLNKMIETNNNYLLNDSLLDYISSMESLTTFINYLSSDSLEHKIDLLTHYYRNIIFEILNNGKKEYLKLLDNDTKIATYHAAHLIKMINDDIDMIYIGNKILLKRLVYVILCYCHINNKMNEYNDICNNYINNFNTITDDLDLHGIEVLDGNFVNRIIYIISKGQNKKIIT